MPISGFLGLRHKKGPTASALSSEGCSEGATRLLENHLRDIMAGRTSTAGAADLRQAIAAAGATLSDPCSDERLVAHLRGMAALLELVKRANRLDPGVVLQLPDRASLERDMAATSERAYRKIALQVQGLRRAQRRGQGGGTEPLGASMAMLRTLNHISVQLRDGATTFAVFAAANNIGRHASQEASRIAELLNLPADLPASTDLTAAPTRPVWRDALDHAQLATVTGVQKTRQPDDEGRPRTVRKVLETSRGHVYELDAPLTDRTGAHGRVHAARAIAGPDGNLIVKVQRTQRKLAGKQDVLDAPLEDLLRSAAASKLASDHVATGLEARAGLFEGGDAPLRGLDARGVSTAVLEHFVDASGKYHQVMPAMAGDLADVSRALSAQVDAAPHLEAVLAQARLSVAAQSFVQLEALHRRRGPMRRGMAHLDLKLGNIVFTEAGIVRLIDYDEARALSALGRVRGGSYAGGSLPSPERDSPAYQRRGGTLARPYDVWCLGAALLELGTPTFTDATPAGPRAVRAMLDMPVSGAPRGFGTAEWFLVYAAFWAQSIDGKGPLQAAPSHPSPESRVLVVRRLRGESQAAENATDAQLGAFVDACYLRLGRFVDQRLQADPKLTALLLRRALAPRPQQRASAKQLAAALTELMAGQSDAQRLATRQMFARLASASPLATQR